MRPLLLAEAPARDGNWREPLRGRAGENLCRHAGLEPTYAALRERFDAMNACERLEGAYPWSAPRARRRWLEWRAGAGGDLVVVCLGRRAAVAAGLPARHPWGEWAAVGRDTITAIPHPSGLCREYNDPDARLLARRVLSEALSGGGPR